MLTTERSIIAIFKLGLFLLYFLSSVANAVDEDVLRFRQERVRQRTEAYLEEGKKEVQRGSYMRGIRLLSQAIAQGAGVDAFQFRGQAYYLAGLYAEAAADFNKVIQGAPRDPTGYNSLGDVYLAKGDYQSALKNYEMAIEVEPLFVDAYIGRGIVYVSLEKYALAINDFQKVLQTAPDDPRCLMNMANACLAADMPTAGRAFLEKALHTAQAPQIKKLIDDELPSFQNTSTYENIVGGLKDYLAKTSGTYESSTVMSLAYSPRGLGDASHPRETSRHAAPLRIRVTGNLPERAGSRINVRTLGGVQEVSGTWDGTYMGLRWNIDFKASGNRISAILKIYSPSGKEDIHYCEGIVRDDGYVEASDNQGYRFTGKLTEDYRVIGTVTLADGKSMNLDLPLE